MKSEARGRRQVSITVLKAHQTPRSRIPAEAGLEVTAVFTLSEATSADCPWGRRGPGQGLAETALRKGRGWLRALPLRLPGSR